MSAKRPSILMIFLDGVGLASRRDRDNPFATDEYAGLSAIAGGLQWTRETFAHTDSDLLRATGIDACLGIDGLPQSGTGQATLFTGVNCAAIVGRHHGPYPHSSTRETIRTRNIFHQLGLQERHSAFANAYPPVFFEYARASTSVTVAPEAPPPALVGRHVLPLPMSTSGASSTTRSSGA